MKRRIVTCSIFAILAIVSSSCCHTRQKVAADPSKATVSADSVVAINHSELLENQLAMEQAMVIQTELVREHVPWKLHAERQGVIDFEKALRPAFASRFNKEIGQLPTDDSPLADTMYVNYKDIIAKAAERVDDTKSTYIGDPVAALTIKAVVSMNPVYPQGALCTGIVIARNAIATAGHCAEGGPRFIRVGHSADGSDGSKQVPIDPTMFIYLKTPSGDYLDMAILVQSKKFEGIEDDDLPVFAPDSLIASAKELTIVGFGGYLTDSSLGGTKRLGTVPMASPDCAQPGEAAHFDCHPGFDIVAAARPMLDRRSCPKPSDVHVLQRGACEGDSGGPAYVMTADKKLALAGLIRAIVDPQRCGCSTATNVYVRFDKQVAYLRGLSGIDFPPTAFALIDGTTPVPH